MPFEPLVKGVGDAGRALSAPNDQERSSIETTASGSHDLTGQILGGTYRILELLDEGGMGRLYRAEHLRLKRAVAVKVLANHLAHNEGALTRFNREAEIVSQLRHPHVVSILDFDQTEQGAPYIVMELLEGESLANKLDRCHSLPLTDVVRIVSQIAGALQTAHQMGIVHRDLKPDNVFLIAIEDEQIFVKLLDFGISKSTNAACKVTREFDVLGTPDYMAPEQAISTASADHRADQFALASMTYEMLTGKMPFTAESVPQLLYKVVNETPACPSVYAPSLSPIIDEVVLKGLEKKPGDRFPHIQDYAIALAQAAGVPVVHTGLAPTAPPPLRDSPPPPVMASLPRSVRPGAMDQTRTNELRVIAQRYEQSIRPPQAPRTTPIDADTALALQATGPLPIFDSNEPGTGPRMPLRPILRSNAPDARDSGSVPRFSVRPGESVAPTHRSPSPGSVPPIYARTPGSTPPLVRPPSSVPPPYSRKASVVREAPTLRPISELESVIADVRRAVAFGEQQRASGQARRAVHLARDCDERAARVCLSEATTLLEPLLLPQVGGVGRQVTLINARVSSQGDWTPAHFFLLSQLEHPTTVDELLDISPLTRPETLCFIADLSAQGIVQIE
jgi:serine/threonine-protein kinase